MDKKKEERLLKAVKDFSKLPYNKRCCDCTEKLPQYVNLTFSTFICTACSGIHREFSHRVKSISLSTFSIDEVKALKDGGNEVCNSIFLARWEPRDYPEPEAGNEQKIRDWIRAKYIERRWHQDSNYQPSRRSGSRDMGRQNSLRNDTDSSRRGSKPSVRPDNVPQSQPISSVLPDVKQVEVKRNEPVRKTPGADLLDLLSGDPSPAPAPAPQAFAAPHDPFATPGWGAFPAGPGPAQFGGPTPPPQPGFPPQQQGFGAPGPFMPQPQQGFPPQVPPNAFGGDPFSQTQYFQGQQPGPPQMPFAGPPTGPFSSPQQQQQLPPPGPGFSPQPAFPPPPGPPQQFAQQPPQQPFPPQQGPPPPQQGGFSPQPGYPPQQPPPQQQGFAPQQAWPPQQGFPPQGPQAGLPGGPVQIPVPIQGQQPPKPKPVTLSIADAFNDLSVDEPPPQVAHATFAQGEEVVYTDSQGKKMLAVIAKIHLDDHPPYYTVKLPTGQERDTDFHHLAKKPPGPPRGPPGPPPPGARGPPGPAPPAPNGYKPPPPPPDPFTNLGNVGWNGVGAQAPGSGGPPTENGPKPSQNPVGPAAFGPGGAPPPNPFAFPDDVDASASGNNNPFFNLPSNPQAQPPVTGNPFDMF